MMHQSRSFACTLQMESAAWIELYGKNASNKLFQVLRATTRLGLARSMVESFFASLKA